MLQSVAATAPSARSSLWRECAPLARTCQGPALFLQAGHEATLSCGGVASLIADQGWSSGIVTVFAREDADLRTGTSARARQTRCLPHEPELTVTQSRAEAACAAAVLGCGAHALGLPDATRRRDGNFNCTPAQLRQEQQDLARAIAIEVLRLPGWREGTQVFVPLPRRRSPDHRIVFEAGRCLAGQGVRVWAYEDLSEALDVSSPTSPWQWRVAGAIGPEVLFAIDTALPRKLDAIGCHASDLAELFPEVDDFRLAVADHAWLVGVDTVHSCERYWPVIG